MSQYEAMLKRSVAELRNLGVEEDRAKELTREAAEQYHRKGQYRKCIGVSERMHSVLRSVVKPYATSVGSSNKRRVDLINEELSPEGLEAKEKEELEGLQAIMLDFRNHVHPLI